MSQTNIIVDTSAFYALLSNNDRCHLRAKQYFERVTDSQQELYTTSYILVETSIITQHRLGSIYYKNLIEALRKILNVIWIGGTIHEEAWKAMNSHLSDDFSLVDWTTAIIASRLKAKVFCFDKKLELIGLSIVP